jgi:hypothetical protein
MMKMKLIVPGEVLPQSDEVVELLNITKYSKHDQSHQQQYISDSQTIKIKGYLLKRNWYGSDQKRFFELYPTGLIRYFEVKGRSTEFKGCTRISSATQIRYDRESQPPSLRFRCQIKDKKEYNLLQPTSEQVVSFQE